jgi:hypothetical protein
MLKKFISILIVAMLVLSLTTISFAEETIGDEVPGSEDTLDQEEVDGEEEEEIEEDDDEAIDDEEDEKGKGKGKGKGQFKEWKLDKENLEKEKDDIEAIKDELEEQKDALEEAIESGLYEGEELESKLAELEALKTELELAKENFSAAKNSFMEIIKMKRQEVYETYSVEEIEEIEVASENITEEDPGATVIPVDSIISDKAKFKFDTPPVIVKNRTLIPVRAITEGFGADVEWLDGVATITKDEKVIELNLDSNTALVNGEEVEIDSKASIKNNRMYVPLRFILETFELEVEWEPETQTIEIN